MWNTRSNYPTLTCSSDPTWRSTEIPSRRRSVCPACSDNKSVLSSRSNRAEFDHSPCPDRPAKPVHPRSRREAYERPSPTMTITGRPRLKVSPGFTTTDELNATAHLNLIILQNPAIQVFDVRPTNVRSLPRPQPDNRAQGKRYNISAGRDEKRRASRA